MTRTANDIAMTHPLQFSSNVDHIPSNSYQSTHATFIKGQLNPAFFKKTSLPQAIYTTQVDDSNHNKPFFTCVALQSNTTDLYKVFSPLPLSSLQLQLLFKEGHQLIAQYPWKAYPKYSPPDEGFSFVLDAAGLYYVNGMEMGASALEVSAIAGKNVANLILEHISNR